MFIKKQTELSTHSIVYYDNQVKNGKPVIFFSPGVWEPGSRYLKLFSQITSHRVILISYRGRGLSTAPNKGFDSFDHACDLNAVIMNEHLNPNTMIFIAFSKGVSYNLAFIEKYEIIPNKLILIDYPPVHTEAPEGYADTWFNMEYKGLRLRDFISHSTLLGVEKESTFYNFSDYLMNNSFNKYVFYGTNKNSKSPSNLSNRFLESYKTYHNTKTFEFKESGHMIIDDEPEKFINILINILKE